MTKFEKCIFIFAKFLLKIFDGRILLCCSAGGQSNCFVKAQKRIFYIFYSIIRLEFLLLLFSYIYFNMIQPCFRNTLSKPTDFKRRITRGVLPLTLIFYLIMTFHPYVGVLNRILAIICFISSIKIFITNDFILEGTYDVNKFSKLENNDFEYSGEIEPKNENNFNFFTQIYTHISKFNKQFRLPFDEYSSNVEFIRTAYCRFSGKIYYQKITRKNLW
jgi:hypothetical protein